MREEREGRACVVYDDSCDFCRGQAERWEERTRGRIEFVRASDAPRRFPDLRGTDRAICWVGPDGEVRRGAEAVFSILAVEGSFGRLLLRARRFLPGFGWAVEAAYRLVASNRRALSHPSVSPRRLLPLLALPLLLILAILVFKKRNFG